MAATAARTAAADPLDASRSRRSPRRGADRDVAGSPRRRRGWQASRPYADADHRRAHRAGAATRALDHPLLRRAGEPAAGRRAGGHQRPRAVRRLQRQRDHGRPRSSSRCCASEGKEPVALRVGRKGVELLPLPQPEIDGELDRLLRAARATTNARGDRARRWSTAFVAGADDDGDDAGDGRHPRRRRAAHRLHQFRSLMTQTPQAPAASRRWRSSTSRTSTGGRHRCRCTSSSRTPDDAARRAAAEVHRHPDLRGAARVGGVGVGGPAAGDEGATDNAERADPKS